MPLGIGQLEEICGRNNGVLFTKCLGVESKSSTIPKKYRDEAQFPITKLIRLFRFTQINSKFNICLIKMFKK